MVLASERVEHPGGVTVYNLEVEGDHTYFVADADTSFTNPVWVHNTCKFFRNPLDALGPGGEDAQFVPRSEVKVKNPSLAAQGFTKKRIDRMPGGEFVHVFFKPDSGWSLSGSSSHVE